MKPPYSNTTARRLCTEMFDDIVAFHEKFQLPPFDHFDAMPADLVAFRQKFLMEEAAEIYEAAMRRQKADALDGFVDLAYVALGTFYLAGGKRWFVETHTPKDLAVFDIFKMKDHVELNKTTVLDHVLDIALLCRREAISSGFYFDEAWKRVHGANMRKVRSKSKDEGKRGSTWDVVKPEGWCPPIMDDLV